VKLEERSIEQLPDRCENCGTELTDAEKAAALEGELSPVLCTTCAAEAETVPAEGEEFEPGSS
jgi:hypothetical protein